MTKPACERMLPQHWDAVRSIFLEGIVAGDATFETEAPSWSQWDAAHLDDPRLVAVEHRSVIGWAALSAVSNRCVYGGVAEVSVYVAAASRGRGVGQALLSSLVSASERVGLWRDVLLLERRSRVVGV